MNPYTQLPRVPLLFGRHALIIERCRGKRVLHIGCVDAGLVESRFERGELMHQRLAAVAGELWGVDIDSKGIAFLSNKGFDHLYTGDICDDVTVAAFQGEHFDVCVASEVVEHLQNPGHFLSAAHRLMVPGQTELIITVPNAFRIDTLLWMLRGVEYVHPDHNYWFSYRTATNLIRKSGLAVQEVYAYTSQPSAILPRRLQRLFTRNPQAVALSEILASPDETVTRPRASVGTRFIAYFRTLPKRILVRWLYRITPFWGDGLIIVTRAVENGQPAI